AFEQCTDPELPADRTNVCAGTTKLKGNGPGRDPKAINPGESVSEFLGQAFTKVVLVATGAHIGEGKNRNGGEIVRCQGWICRDVADRCYEAVAHAGYGLNVRSPRGMRAEGLA